MLSSRLQLSLVLWKVLVRRLVSGHIVHTQSECLKLKDYEEESDNVEKEDDNVEELLKQELASLN